MIPKMMTRQAKVDKELCIGCSLCTRSYPKSFKLEDDGKSTALAPASDSEECVQKAIDECPVQAIS